jgi:hypothetical protein
VRKTASALTGAIATDPLSVDPADVDGLLRRLRATGQDLQSTIALKRGFDDRIAEARALLEQIQVAVGEAQAAHEEAQAKIADPQVPPPLEVDKGLDSDLDDIVELGRENAWRDATRALEDWRARANASLGDARRTLAVIRAPIETRNQYRAMLEAYQVKAERHGVLEDTELADVAARAAEALYTAPTDLALSAELIRSYQWAVNAAEGTPEATR